MLKFDFDYDNIYYIFMRKKEMNKQNNYSFSDLKKLPIHYNSNHKYISNIKVN